MRGEGTCSAAAHCMPSLTSATLLGWVRTMSCMLLHAQRGAG